MNKSEKNLHLDHIEDSIINQGSIGIKRVMNYLQLLLDDLKRNSNNSSINVSLKYDGAPAIFAGIDPIDNRFFVAKKSIFNKNPKVYKTEKDIDGDISNIDLNNKMKLALKHLPALGIKGVVQGDFLYSKEDIHTVDIDGKPYITFHPNTIVYAVPKESKLALQILASELGVVWHTEYTGNSFESMSANFGKQITGNFKKEKSVWSIDASYNLNNILITNEEYQEVSNILFNINRIYNSIDLNILNGFSKNRDLKIRIGAYINTNIKVGKSIDNIPLFIDGFIEYIKDYYAKEANKLKTDKGKQVKYDKLNDMITCFDDRLQIEKMFEMYNLVISAKNIFLEKLNKNQDIHTFLKTINSYEKTNHEGYVITDRYFKRAYKLVDRLRFSKANFNSDYIKGFDKRI